MASFMKSAKLENSLEDEESFDLDFSKAANLEYPFEDLIPTKHMERFNNICQSRGLPQKLALTGLLGKSSYAESITNNFIFVQNL